MMLTNPEAIRDRPPQRPRKADQGEGESSRDFQSHTTIEVDPTDQLDLAVLCGKEALLRNGQR